MAPNEVAQLPKWTDIAANIGLEAAYFTGLSRLAERRVSGRGAILKFERVRPRSRATFQPLANREITPAFLSRVIDTLKRLSVDIVSIDDAVRRMNAPSEKRFVALTFDGAYRDFVEHAYPVLQRHGVPFALYLPTGFIDHIAEAWWLALEAVITKAPRIALVINGEERRFRCTTTSEKYAVFDVIHNWMMSLPAHDLSAAINDVCRRYGVDLQFISRDMAIDWSDVSKLAADPRATIGSATVNYFVAANNTSSVVAREMKMGRTVLETALRRPCAHFAYPFGAPDNVSARDVLLAREAGFSSAALSQADLLFDDQDILKLPRIAWDGRRTSTRALQVLLSGLMLPKTKSVAVTTAAAD